MLISKSQLAVILAFGLLGPSVSWAEGESELTWIWANPSPHGNNVVELLFQDGLYVQLADHGQAYLSYDGEFWIPQTTGTRQALRSGAFYDGHLIIVGAEGVVARARISTNSLAEFEVIHLGTTNWLEAVTASPSLLVAVGDNGTVFTSPNGQLWSQQSPGFTTWLRGIAYGSGTFLAVGEHGFAATSSNGTQWQVRNPPVATHLNRVAWLGDRFWVVGDAGVVLTTTTGKSWTILKTGATNDLYGVAGLDTDRLVVGQDEVRLGQRQSGISGGYSWSQQVNPDDLTRPPAWTYYAATTDGESLFVAGKTGMLLRACPTNNPAPYAWFPISESCRGWLWDLIQIPTIYVAAGDLGTILTSDDGAHWQRESVPTNVQQAVFLGIGGNAEGLVAVGTRGSMIFSAADEISRLTTNQTLTGTVVVTNWINTLGLIWQAIEPRATSNDLQGIARHQNQWLATGGEGTILSSSDGLQWTQQTTPTRAFLSSVTRYPQGWVAVGDAGTVLTSPDGLNWHPQTTPATHWLYRVRFLQNCLVAVGEAGRVLVSSNGINWVVKPSGTEAWLNDVAYIAGTYWAIGTQGTLISSTNLEFWTPVPSLTGKSLYGLSADPYQLVTVGIEGVILRGQSGPALIREYTHRQTTNFFGVSGLPGRSITLDSSSDLKQWSTGPIIRWLDHTGIAWHVQTNAPTIGSELYRPTPRPNASE